MSLFEQGLREIENLEEYTGLKCIFLESNGITEIKGKLFDCEITYIEGITLPGLDHLCTNLRTLYLQNNRISSTMVIVLTS